MKKKEMKSLIHRARQLGLQARQGTADALWIYYPDGSAYSYTEEAGALHHLDLFAGEGSVEDIPPLVSEALCLSGDGMRITATKATNGEDVVITAGDGVTEATLVLDLEGVGALLEQITAALG